jgi:hypothetical protein
MRGRAKGTGPGARTSRQPENDPTRGVRGRAGRQCASPRTEEFSPRGGSNLEPPQETSGSAESRERVRGRALGGSAPRDRSRGLGLAEGPFGGQTLAKGIRGDEPAFAGEHVGGSTDRPRVRFEVLGTSEDAVRHLVVHEGPDGLVCLVSHLGT